MNILIITQVVDENDPVLGFFCDWVLEFSKVYDQVTIIALRVGKYTFPANVSVHSLGKEKKRGRLHYLHTFFSLIFKKRKDYDAVFVHMNPVYLVLAGWYWKFLGKKVFLWYTHRQTDLKLRIATFFTNRVFTASPEGFQLTTKKKTVLGHGINLERFNRSPKKKSGDTYFKIVHVGRITPIKNIDVLLEAVYLLKKKNIPVRLSLVGPATTPQETKEKDHLIELINRYTLQAQVDFLGGISFEKLPEVFQKADISVNLAPTGGMDKAVLESLASATPALFSNKAFCALYGSYAPELFFTERDVNSLCIGLEAFWVKSNEEKERMGNLLQQWVREEHNLSKLIKKIYTYGLE